MSNNELRHFKYVDKYKKNGKWIYVYPGENAKKNVFGRIRGGTGSLQAHQRLNREATNQVAKNTPSRNVPGANDQSATTPGKQITKKQIRQGIRKAKIKTLKREAAAAIKRAQDWLKDLFD